MLSRRDLSHFAPLRSDITMLFAERLRQGRAPASFFMVFDEEGALFEGGLGGRSLGGPAPDRQTRFRIASCTKSFTAAALLILRDAGKLGLDEPITRFVPQLRAQLPLKSPVVPTVRMLMTMSGGLSTDDPWADRQESLSRAAFLGILQKGVRFNTVPGTQYEYSNLGYALLGQVVEQVSGASYQDFVAEALFHPLGLEMTHFDYRAIPSAQMAVGYRPCQGEWLALPFSCPGAFSSIGGVISTGEDLAKWASWLSVAFYTDLPEKGPLSAASRREMQNVHCPIPLEPGEGLLFKGYGFGLVAQAMAPYGLTVSHSGGYPGFSAHMCWNPAARIGVVGFENATYAGVREPVMAALTCLLNRAASRMRAEPADEVAILGQQVARLVGQWDDELAATLCLENVALDRSYAERAAELAMLRAMVGTPDIAGAEILPVDQAAWGRFKIRVPCRTGAIIGMVEIGPPQPARIQAMAFREERWPAW